MAFSKDQLLKAAEMYSRKTTVVDVSEWLGEGATFRVRELSAGEQAPLNAMLTEAKMGREGATERYNIMLVVKGAVDDNGTRMFTDEEYATVAVFPNPVVNKVSAAVARLNGIPKKLEETAKN